ncbi:MAG: hypothetical protein ACE5GX_13020 [Thermoanaerobaculia bacterium]
MREVGRRHTLRGAAALALAITTCASQLQRSEPVEAPPARVSRLARIAAALERPAERFQLLEAESLDIVFVEGSYETYTVRDLETGDTIELSLDLSTNERVDPAAIRARDRELAGAIEEKLQPTLFELLLAHPELDALEVVLVFDLEAVREPNEEPVKDWLEPDLRERFGEALMEELRKRQVEATVQLRSDFPWARCTLSARELAALGRSELIERVSLVGSPDIIDD